jgi:DNA-binding NarL/FixJ family response regulator
MIQQNASQPLYALDEILPFPGMWGLTPREKHIARLAGACLDNQQIGEIANLSAPTARNYVHTVCTKAFCQNRTDFAVWCALASRVDTIRLLRTYNPNMFSFMASKQEALVLVSQREMDVMYFNTAGGQYRDIGEDVGATGTMVSTSMFRIRDKITFRPTRTELAVMFVLAKHLFAIKPERPRGKAPISASALNAAQS